MRSRIQKFLVGLTLSSITPMVAQVTWDGGGNGTTWGDDLNWVGDSKPVAGDTIQLEGATVTVNSAEAYSGISSTGADGSLIVANGGVLTSNASTTALRFVNGITIENGGLLIANPANDIRSVFLNINDGGELTGTDSIFDADTLTIGGIFRPIDSVNDGSNQYRIGSPTTTGIVEMASTGTLYLDVFDNGVNESFVIDDSSASVSTLDLSVGSIILDLQGAYVPQIGDSFDLWDDLMTGGNPNIVIPGTGSNISLPGHTLDLSNWATDGIVTVVPEPRAAIALGMVGLAAVLFWRRRRQ